MLSEKPVPVITGRQPMTLHVLVYMACMLVSISALVAYVLPFCGLRKGFLAKTPQLKEAVLRSCEADRGVRQLRAGHRIMLCRRCRGMKDDGASLR